MFVVAFDFSTLLKSGIPPIRIIFIDWSIIAIKTSVINIFWLKKLFIFIYIGEDSFSYIVTWDFIIPAPIKNTSVASKTVPIVYALKGYSNL